MVMAAYDEQPAQGDWPGGTRYGFERHVILRDRTWTTAEQYVADKYGVRLPLCDLWCYDTWFDRPEMVRREIVTQNVMVNVWHEIDDPIARLPFTVMMRHAKRYGDGRWVSDPLAGVRDEVKRCGDAQG